MLKILSGSIWQKLSAVVQPFPINWQIGTAGFVIMGSVGRGPAVKFAGTGINIIGCPLQIAKKEHKMKSVSFIVLSAACSLV